MDAEPALGISMQQQLAHVVLDRQRVDAPDRIGLGDRERKVGADADLGRPEAFDQVQQADAVVDQAVDPEAARPAAGASATASRSTGKVCQPCCRRGSSIASEPPP